jgi:hypothetical protein
MRQTDKEKLRDAKACSECGSDVAERQKIG